MLEGVMVEVEGVQESIFYETNNEKMNTKHLTRKTSENTLEEFTREILSNLLERESKTENLKYLTSATSGKVQTFFWKGQPIGTVTVDTEYIFTPLTTKN